MMKRDDRCKLWIFSFCVGLINYGTTWAHDLSNPDAVNVGAYKHSWEWEAQLGRFMLRYWQDLFGGAVSHFLVTVLSVAVLAAIVVMIAGMLLGKDASWGKGGILIALLLICSPNVQSTLTYYYCSLYYMIAFFLQVLSLQFLIGVYTELQAGNYGRVGKNMLLAIVCMTVSLGTYQAYITVFMVLALLRFIGMLSDVQTGRKAAILYAGICLLGAAFGTGGYLLVNRVFLKIVGMEMTTGRGFDKIGKIDVSKLGGQIKNCYNYLGRYFFGASMINNDYGIVPRSMVNGVFFVCMAALVAVQFFIIVRRKGVVDALLMAAGYAVLPVAALAMLIAAPGVSFYKSTGILLVPAMNLIYVSMLPVIAGLAAMIENTGLRKLAMLPGVVLICVIVMLLKLNNDAQVYAQYNMDKARQIAAQMSERINGYVDKVPDRRVCVIGSMREGNYPERYEDLAESVHWLTASLGAVLERGGQTNGWLDVMSVYMGETYRSVTSEEAAEIRSTKEFQEMEMFPYKGSVAIIHDAVVVKMSEQ